MAIDPNARGTETNPYNTSSGPDLRFPFDREGDYPGVIEFRRVTYQPPQVSLQQPFERIQQRLNSAFDFFGGTASSTPDEPDLTTDTVRPVEQGQVGYFRNASPNVRLYLPQAIQLTDAITYDNNVELGIIGGALNRSLEGTGNLGKAVEDAVQAGATAITDILKNMSDPRVARIALARAPLPQTIADPIRNVTRTVVNPNRKTLFRDIRPREFTFTFKMIATSPREADEITNIVQFFRTEMYPNPVAPGGLRIAYEYPNMFDIRMRYNGSRVGYNILPCFLTTFNATYNPSNMGYHVDGKPSEMDVTMTFFEERPIDRSDVLQGF